MFGVRKLRNKILASASIMAMPFFMAHTTKADATDPALAQKYEAEADSLVAKNDLKAAQIALKNARKANPQDNAIRLKLASVEFRFNDIEGAQIDLKAARQNGGDETKIIPMLAQTYLMQGKFDEVLQEFPIRNDSTAEIRAATLTVRANAQIGLNHLDEARTSLIAAETLQPNAAAPKLALAQLDMRGNQADSALKKVDEAIQIAPSAEAHYLKATILVTRNDAPGALAEVNAALTADPGHVPSLIERAQLFIAQGQDAQADADIKAAVARAPRAVAARYFEALLLVRAKDYEGADTILTKYADGYSQFPEGFFLQATVKSELKQYEQAQTAIEAYLAAIPTATKGQKLKAYILIRKGDFSAAADLLRRITDQDPKDAEAFAMLGEAYKQTDPQRSVEAFGKAAALAPNDPIAVRGLALDHITENQGASGVAELEKLVQMTPDDSHAVEALVMAYMVDKQYAKAGKLIADLTQKRPDDPVAADMTGLLEQAQSHTAEAKTAFLAVEKKFPDFAPVKLQLATIYEVEGDRDRARDLYQAILSKDPASLQALNGLSAIMTLRNQPDQILDLWKKAYRTQPDNITIEFGLINAYLINKDVDGAFSAVRDMLVRRPKEPQLYGARAKLEVQKGAYKDAVISLQRMNELQPANPIALRDLALVQQKAGDLPGALVTIAAARKLDPTNPILAADEVSMVGANNPDKGIAAAQRFASLLPEEPAAQAVEGDYLLSLKRPADALAAYQRALKANPSLFLATRLSQAAVKSGKPADGEKALRDWSAAHPQDVAARSELAGFLQSQKNFPAAKTLYEGLLQDRPGDPAILNNLALIYQHDGDPRALDLARRAASAAPDNPQIADTLGWIMAQKDDAAGGLKLLQRAHELSPGDLDTQYHLAFVLNQTGNKTDAAALLKSALSSGADFDSKSAAQSLLGQLSKS
jgi:putative PEP-CTERM system TPR-repeat lipoprotein